MTNLNSKFATIAGVAVLAAIVLWMVLEIVTSEGSNIVSFAIN